MQLLALPLSVSLPNYSYFPQLLLSYFELSMPNCQWTGRLGCWAMEMNGGSSASSVTCTPCVPLLCTVVMGVATEGLLYDQGSAGIISIVQWSLRPVTFVVEIQITSGLHYVNVFEIPYAEKSPHTHILFWGILFHVISCNTLHR